MIAETRFALGRALWDSDTDLSRATSLAKEARAGYLQTKDGKHADEINAWWRRALIRNRRAENGVRKRHGNRTQGWQRDQLPK
jgi:hypothetical protein